MKFICNPKKTEATNFTIFSRWKLPLDCRVRNCIWMSSYFSGVCGKKTIKCWECYSDPDGIRFTLRGCRKGTGNEYQDL